MPRLIINCKDYALLVSGCMDRRLSFWETLSLKLHALLCPPCKQVGNQMALIRQACRFIPADRPGAPQSQNCLSEQARMKIKAALKNNH